MLQFQNEDAQDRIAAISLLPMVKNVNNQRSRFFPERKSFSDSWYSL
jgi:hypothetical protein